MEGMSINNICNFVKGMVWVLDTLVWTNKIPALFHLTLLLDRVIRNLFYLCNYTAETENNRNRFSFVYIKSILNETL